MQFRRLKMIERTQFWVFLNNKRTSSSSSSASSCGVLVVSESVLALDAAMDASSVLPKLPAAESGLPGLLDPASIRDTRRRASRVPTTVDWARRLFCRLSVRRLRAARPLADDAGGSRRLLSEVMPAPPLHLLIIHRHNAVTSRLLRVLK